MRLEALPLGVVFDMDGLIFDSEKLYQDAMLELARELEIAAIDKSAVQAAIGLSWDATKNYFSDLIGEESDIDLLIEKWMARYDALAEKQLALKPGVLELIETLADMAIPMAIATGSVRPVVYRHLADHNLLGSFDAIVTKEDCREGKPAPEPFLAAAISLGIPPQQCWALEDSRNGIISAHTAGMSVIMVPDLIEPNEDDARYFHCKVSSLFEVKDMLAHQSRTG